MQNYFKTKTSNVYINRMCGYSKGFGKTKEKRAIQMMAPLQPHCFLLQTTLRKTTTTYHGAHTDDMLWTSHWSVGFADIANTANPTSRIRSYKFYEGIQKALNIQAQQKTKVAGSFAKVEKWHIPQLAVEINCWTFMKWLSACCLKFPGAWGPMFSFFLCIVAMQCSGHMSQRY